MVPSCQLDLTTMRLKFRSVPLKFVNSGDIVFEIPVKFHPGWKISFLKIRAELQRHLNKYLWYGVLTIFI